MSAEQVVLKLPQIEVQTAQGKSLALACTEAEISEQSYRWRKEYGGLQVDEARKIKDLERENAQLRRLMADLSLVSQVPAGGCWHPGEVRSPGTSRLPDRRPTPRAQRYVPTVLADEDELTRAIIAGLRVRALWLPPRPCAAASSRLAGGQGSGSAHLASRRIAVGDRVLRKLPWQAARRGPAPGNLLLAEGGTGRDRSMAEPIQPRPAALVSG
jgi:putative transposase